MIVLCALLGFLGTVGNGEGLEEVEVVDFDVEDRDTDSSASLVGVGLE